MVDSASKSDLNRPTSIEKSEPLSEQLRQEELSLQDQLEGVTTKKKEESYASRKNY